MKRKDWHSKTISIPIALLDKEKYPSISATAVLIYAYIHALPRYKDENNDEYASCSVAEIKRFFGCSSSTVIFHLSMLKQYDLLQSYRAGFGGANRYIIKEVED